MAQKKISQLPAASEVIATDLVPVVDDPSGTAVTQKATWSQVRTYIMGLSGGVSLLTEPTRITSTTTPQLRVAYDGSNHFATTIASNGQPSSEITGTGKGLGLALLHPLTIGFRAGAPDDFALGIFPGTVAYAGTGAYQLSGVSQFGVLLGPQFSSSATTKGHALNIDVVTEPAAFTLPVGTAIHIGAGVKGAGSTITTQYGLRIADQLLGATNYAIYTNAGLVRFGDAVTVASGGIAVTGNSTITGTLGGITTLTTSGAINSQTISATANFTGTLTTAGALTVSAGGAAITGTGSQLQLLRDGSNYMTIGVGVSGVTTLDLLGAAAEFVFNKRVQLVAPTTSTASLRLPHGSAPSVPVNGDVWTTTAGLYVHINGVTVGPLS